MSWSLLSIHTFVTGMSINSGVCVFVTVSPTSTVPPYVTSYPVGTFSSLIVYTMSTPSSLFGKSSNVPFHPFPSFNVSVFPLTGVPFANNVTVICVGLNLSWLLLSTHTFVTGMSIVSGVPVNSTVTVSVTFSISTIGCSASPVPSSLISSEVSSPFNHNVFLIVSLLISIFILTVVAKSFETFK